MRILYVEDNQANVYLVKRVALGHEVINYIDGEQALQSIAEDDPDLILMDIQLAGPMSGLDVVRKLRADGNETPIIAVTAYAMIGDREKCLAAGCNDYLAKPLPITQLIGLIKKYSELTDLRITQQAEAVVAQDDDTSDEQHDDTVDVTNEDIEPPVSEVEDEALIFDMDKEKSRKTDDTVSDDNTPSTPTTDEHVTKDSENNNETV